jgi:hypothetical protein
MVSTIETQRLEHNNFITILPQGSNLGLCLNTKNYSQTE